MKRIALKIAWLCVLSLAFASAAGASTQLDGGQRGSLLKADDLAPLTVGADYEQQSNREVICDEGERAKLGYRHYSAYVGIEALPWMTVFGTIGQVEAKSEGRYGDGHVIWSLGAHANLFQYDVSDPAFLEGRLSVRTEVELTMADFEADAEGGKWQERNASVTLNYEIFVDTPDSTDRVPYSLALFVGPAYSSIDGEFDDGPDFEEDRQWGLAFGADLFASHNFSIGFHMERFEHYSYRTGFRYRF